MAGADQVSADDTQRLRHPSSPSHETLEGHRTQIRASYLPGRLALSAPVEGSGFFGLLRQPGPVGASLSLSDRQPRVGLAQDQLHRGGVEQGAQSGLDPAHQEAALPVLYGGGAVEAGVPHGQHFVGALFAHAGGVYVD
uniref:(northern house mosquito) hypothetical protein n=1 Tax=Culex pipiens TaxID=7175 RepID=A0A8D8BR04_CULPI